MKHPFLHHLMYGILGALLPVMGIEPPLNVDQAKVDHPAVFGLPTGTMSDIEAVTVKTVASAAEDLLSKVLAANPSFQSLVDANTEHGVAGALVSLIAAAPAVEPTT